MVAPHTHSLPVPTNSWLDEWLRTPLKQATVNGHMGAADARALSATLTGTILAYTEWFESDGLMELHSTACRRARGDWDKATEATTETFLDVRTRLEGAVARALAGKSIPELSSREEVVRYHSIQLTLRLKGRWTRTRNHVDMNDLPLGRPECTTRTVETRRQALPLHVAASWFLADLSGGKGARDGDWWWRILRHCLNLDTVTDLGGARNDPTEAHLRIQARFATCRGMRAVLEALAGPALREHAVTVDLAPWRPHEDVHSEVCDLMHSLRDRLAEAIEALALDASEAAALHKVLVQGATVRTRLSAFQGEDAAARRQRLWTLCEEVGQHVARVERTAGRRAA